MGAAINGLFFSTLIFVALVKKKIHMVMHTFSQDTHVPYILHVFKLWTTLYKLSVLLCWISEYLTVDFYGKVLCLKG